MQPDFPVARPRPNSVNADRYEGVPILGLPADPRVVLVSTSERGALGCDRRWLYGYGLGMRGAPSDAMTYGTAWHEVMEDVHRFLMRLAPSPSAGPTASPPPYEDAYLEACGLCFLGVASDGSNGGNCPCCGSDGSAPGDGPLLRIESRWRAEAAAGKLAAGDEGEEEEPDESIEQRVERLRRAAQGWLRVNGRVGLPGYDVVGVELAVACPVRSPGSTKPYNPEVPLAFVPGGWRFARPDDPSATVRRVRWPWYWIGRVDAVFRSRTDGSLLVGEWKSSRDPTGYVRGITVDPQTYGYGAMLDHVRDHFGGGRVRGFLFDVASSVLQRDPDTLAKGGLSVAMNRTVPSWRFEAAVAARGEDPTSEKYADHICALREQKDPRLYVREPGGIGAIDLAAWHVETFAMAKRIAENRRNVADAIDVGSVALLFPRQPVCRQPGGFCSYRGPCSADGPDARRAFPVRVDPVWTDPNLPLAAGNDAAPVTQPSEKEESWL